MADVRERERSTRGPARRSPVSPGDVIGDRYVIGELIGEGGMGVVCEAKHVALGASVAVKLIHPEYRHDYEFVQRFLNEARRAALLKGEHVARVHDVGQLETGEPYLVMERLDGVVLDKYLSQCGALAAPDAVGLVLQVCDGLAEAHAQGIVHRDIKPGNLFLVRLPNGRVSVKILDFGISKQICDDAPSSLTNRDRSLGSPWYMSPEQMMDSSSVNHLTDVWSLGVVLFELLTNERPFDGATIPEVCAKVLAGPTPSLREVRPDVDPELEAVVSRCLAKDAFGRYPDVSALAAALAPFSASRGEAAAGHALEPLGSFLAPTSADPGSIAPLSTTRRVGVATRGRRARSFGLVGIAVSLLLVGAALAKVLLSPGSLDFVRLGPPAPALNPSPEMEPLDKGNSPLELAAPGPPTVEPADVVPMPEENKNQATLEPSGPPTVAAPSDVERPMRHRQRDSQAASENAWQFERDLRSALGRAGDEYRRSLGAVPSDDEREEPAREQREREAAPSESSRDKADPPRPPRDPAKPPRDPRNRYGI